jgi:hypothetical protein
MLVALIAIGGASLGIWPAWNLKAYRPVCLVRVDQCNTLYRDELTHR